MLLVSIALYVLGMGQTCLLIQEWDRKINLRAVAVIMAWPVVIFGALSAAVVDKTLER